MVPLEGELYQKLGLKTLQQRRWCEKLCCFYKILKLKPPSYLHKLVPIPSRSNRTRQCNQIPSFNVTDITNSESIGVFLIKVLAFTRPTPNFTFNCHNIKGLKLLTRLRLGLSHLRKHKFKHSFHDSLNPSALVETVTLKHACYILLDCSNFSDDGLALLSSLINIDATILQRNDANLTDIYFLETPPLIKIQTPLS